jgi:signal peptidase II
VVVIDQIAKTLALRTLDDGPILVVGQAGFRLAFNTGAAFSLGTDSTSLLIVISFAAVVLLLAVSGVVSNRLPATAVALIIGGAAGNVIDRLFRQHDGAVVDFFDLGFWPVFNFADVAIVTGCGLLIWSSFRGEPRDDAT